MGVLKFIENQRRLKEGAERSRAEMEKELLEEAKKAQAQPLSPKAIKEAEELRKIRMEKRAREAGTNAPPAAVPTNAPAVKPLSKLDGEEKSQLVAAARVALADPVADDFWSQVGQELDRIDAPEHDEDGLITPRLKRTV
jgi:hypothetical protein